jgi:hypothetical protein
MQKLSSREYSVTSGDFPVAIQIEAKDMLAFQAAVSSILAVDSSGNITREFRRPLVNPAGALTGSVTLQDPAGAATPPAEKFAGPAGIHLVLLGGFATANGTKPRYEITIQPQAGSSSLTTINQPTATSGRAMLVFNFS